VDGLLPACVLTMAALLLPDKELEDPLPPLSLAKCLPSEGYARERRAYGNKFAESYKGPWELRCIVHDAAWCWGKVEAAQSPTLGVRARRQALRELVNWLGWEAVLTGRIPPPVPLDWTPEVP
jgi:hypothetical protein